MTEWKKKMMSGMIDDKKRSSLLTVILSDLVACVLYGVGAGLRSDMGILLNPMAAHCGLQYKDVSMCIAVMQLVFGAAQPIFGMIALKISNRSVLMLGIVLMGCSMMGMMLSGSYLSLMLSLGVLFGLGAGALAFGLVLTSTLHFVGREHAMIISGMLNAAAGMMGFILSPVLQALIQTKGLITILAAMTGIVAVLIPVAIVITSRDSIEKPSENEERRAAFGGEELSLFKEAFANQTFRLHQGVGNQCRLWQIYSTGCFTLSDSEQRGRNSEVNTCGKDGREFQCV